MHSICLYCGSRPGANPLYAAAARETGTLLAGAGYRLVYGAGDRGLMGEAATAMKAAGGHVTGFIPRHIVEWEVGKRDIDSMILTETMHERKKLMFVNSDAVLALPGGPGTLDELIEVLTWRVLGLHQRPVVVLNTDGYWAPFVALIRHMADREFVDPGILDYFTLAETPAAAIAALDDALSRRSASEE